MNFDKITQFSQIIIKIAEIVLSKSFSFDRYFYSLQFSDLTFLLDFFDYFVRQKIDSTFTDFSD